MYIFAHDGHDHSKEIIEAAQNNNLGLLIITGVAIGLSTLIVFVIHRLKK